MTRTLTSLLAMCLLCCAPPPAATSAATHEARPSDSTAAIASSVPDLPVVEARSAEQRLPVLAIILSGDGGWADIDKRVGEGLAEHGVSVVGLDMRRFLRQQRQTPETSAAAIATIVRTYLSAWHLRDVALIGYSRGSIVLPFIMNRLPHDVRSHVTSLTYLTLLERASFQYRFSDLWRTTSEKGDLPILPELEQIKDVPMLCIYGRDESESLCRTAPAGLMTVVERSGGHHFDGNYKAIAALIYDEIVRTERSHATY